MSRIYDQHRAAFASVSAFVIHDGTRRVATIAVRFPRDGAGRLWVYLHWIGVPMVRAYASGFGYAKTDAALASASAKVERDENQPDQARFLDVLTADNGVDWQTRLRAAGFCVYQAV